jgi:hypothetical protein
MPIKLNKTLKILKQALVAKQNFIKTLIKIFGCYTYAAQPPLTIVAAIRVPQLNSDHAARALAQVSYGALDPGRTPSVPRGQPYTGRGCSSVYACRQPPSAGAP